MSRKWMGWGLKEAKAKTIVVTLEMLLGFKDFRLIGFHVSALANFHNRKRSRIFDLLIN